MAEFSATQILVAAALLGAVVAAIVLLIGRRAGEGKRTATDLQKRVRQVGTFEARDGKGHVVTLSIFQEYIDASTRLNPNAERKGRRYILSADGRLVDKLGTRRYRVMGASEVLTSDDPNAV